MSLEYLATSMVVILLPGTGVLYTLSVGVGKGLRSGVVAAFGCTLGIVPHVLASVAGLAALLHTSALAFQTVKYLGVAYLFYMAWSILRDRGVLQVAAQPGLTSVRQIVISGVLLNLLNPKLSIFFLAFLPQFVAADSASPTIAMLGLAAVFMLLTFLVFAGYGACAALARDYVISRPRVLIWLRRSFAGAFGLLGMRLALADR
jgi:threonine/homoserine/homoserine lactone efflux protein